MACIIILNFNSCQTIQYVRMKMKILHTCKRLVYKHHKHLNVVVDAAMGGKIPYDLKASTLCEFCTFNSIFIQ